MGVYILVQSGLGLLQLGNRGSFKCDPKMAVSGMMSAKIIVFYCQHLLWLSQSGCVGSVISPISNNLLICSHFYKDLIIDTVFGSQTHVQVQTFLWTFNTCFSKLNKYFSNQASFMQKLPHDYHGLC